jgi:hypothetical protein
MYHPAVTESVARMRVKKTFAVGQSHGKPLVVEPESTKDRKHECPKI